MFWNIRATHERFAEGQGPHGAVQSSCVLDLEDHRRRTSLKPGSMHEIAQSIDKLIKHLKGQ